ncbi:MAG: NAD(P)H-dependent oxidoreductase [Rhizomicrobium sp.]
MLALLSHLQSMLPAATAQRILVVNGHPDPRPERFCAAVCAAYAKGARTSGFRTRRLDIGRQGLPFEVWKSGAGVQGDLAQMLEGIWWADRLFVVYPMWFDGPPPALKFLFDAFAERRASEKSLFGAGELQVEDREARVVVTTSLPALLYRAGTGKVATPLPGLRIAQSTYIGSVDTISPADRGRWLDRIYTLGLREKRNPRRQKSAAERPVS